MGWVSYLEDIRDRVESELNRLNLTVSRKPSPGEIEHNKEVVQAIYRQTSALLDEINKLLEIATDPSINTAHEIRVLKLQLQILEKDKAKLKNNVQVLEAELSAERKTREKIEHERDSLLSLQDKTDTKPTGIIKMYDGAKKYGFITPNSYKFGNPDIYFNFREWLSHELPKKGDRVRFFCITNDKRMWAEKVEKLK